MNCRCADFLLRCCCAHFVAWMVTHDLMFVPKVFDCTPVTSKNGRPRTYGIVSRAPLPAGSIFVHQLAMTTDCLCLCGHSYGISLEARQAKHIFGLHERQKN